MRLFGKPIGEYLRFAAGVVALVVVVGVGFAVVLAIITGTDNIYSLPEYSGGGEGKTFFHAFAHFFIAPFVAGLIAWGLSSLVMLVTKAATRTARTAA